MTREEVVAAVDDGAGGVEDDEGRLGRARKT